MKLRNKIVMAVMLLVFIPMVFAVVGISFLTNYQSMKMQSEYGFTVDAMDTFINPVKMLDWLTSKSFSDIQKYSRETPDRFKEIEFLDEINSNMDSNYAFLAVRCNNEFIYIGENETFRRISKGSYFPEYNASKNNSDMVYLSGSFPCMVKQHDFKFSDGSEVSAFIVIKMNDVLPEIKRMIIGILVIIVSIMLLSGILLITWIYKSILKPINTLSNATNRISKGDLDFSLKDCRKEQIGSIFDDFEHMRLRLKELIENQKMYEKESRELISNISHDLKTPLSSIKGYAEGILDGVASTPERQEKYLRTIYSKAVAMTALVDELSLYARIEGNEVPLDKQPTNVDQYFGECVEALILDVEINGMRMNYINTVDKDVNVVIDVEQIRRVFNNIITNAVKYVEVENGQILVRIDDENDFIHVSIADNGKGISEEDLPYIFDRFYRTDASRNSKKGGSGLGLSIAKKIIERHEGKIWATSRVGVGTTMNFTLPKQKMAYKDEKSLRRKTIYPMLKITTAMKGKHNND